jgi:hypothetical protein
VISCGQKSKGAACGHCLIMDTGRTTHGIRWLPGLDPAMSSSALSCEAVKLFSMAYWIDTRLDTLLFRADLPLAFGPTLAEKYQSRHVTY